MQRLATRFLVLFALSATLFVSGPVGCGRTTLAPDGIYQGDTFLYNAEKSINGAYASFDSFLKWEEAYRAVLPVEISRAADTIRKNAQKWIDSAIALHEAYLAVPTKENRDKFSLSLSIIQAALKEVAKYQTEKKAIAPSK